MKKSFWLILIFIGVIAEAAEVVEISSAFVRDLGGVEELRGFERRLTRLTASRVRRNCRLQLEFGNPAAVPGLQTDFASLPWHAVLTGGRAWSQDLTLASQLGGVLAAAHAGSDGKEAAKPLPVWLTAALFQQIQERNSSERYHGRNRRYPAAGALLENGFKLMPQAFAEEFVSPAGSAERLWQQEFGRLLLDLAMAYSPETFGTGIPFYKKRASGESKRINLPFSPEKLPDFVWHNPEFVPFSLMEQTVQNLLKLQISALDKEGVPTGESVEITIEQLPEKLKKRPEAKTIVNLYGRKLQEFSRRVPGELAKVLQRLGSAVWKWNTSRDSAEALLQACRNFRQALQRRKERAAVLDEEEKKYSGVQRYAPLFSCDWSFSMLNREESNFLSETEHFFSR